MEENPLTDDLDMIDAVLTRCRERVAELRRTGAKIDEVAFLATLTETLRVRLAQVLPDPEAAPSPSPASSPAPSPSTTPTPPPAPTPTPAPAPDPLAAAVARAVSETAERDGATADPAPVRFTTADEEPEPLTELPVVETEPESAPAATPEPLIRRLGHQRDVVMPNRPAPKPVINWEQWLGEKLFLKLAMLLVVAGVAWAFKYAYDIGWWGALPPVVKVLTGLLAGGGLVAGGLVAERRDAYRAWGRGIVAAGWPLIYFTVYAAHHFEASRIITSPVFGMATLCATAAAAIGFSLRYKSEYVTIVGYALGYLALLLSGAAAGVLVAGAIFTVSLAVLLSRFRWQWLGITGLLGSAVVYFAHLQPSLSHTGIGLEFLAPKAAFWSNVWFPTLTWASIALAGHFAARGGRWVLPAYITVKNAFIYFTCFALTPHVHDPVNEYLFPLLLGLAHVVLAIHARHVERRPLFVAEAAVGAALLLLAAAIKLTGVWLSLAWVSQAVVLVLLGVWFMERPLRLSGYIALLLGAGRILVIDVPIGGLSTFVLAGACALLAASLLRARRWDVLTPEEKFAPEVMRWGAVAAAALGLVVEVPLEWIPAAIAALTALVALQQPNDEQHAGVQTAVLLTGATGLATLRACLGVAGLIPSLGLIAIAAAATLAARRFTAPRAWTASLAGLCAVVLAYAELPLTSAALVITLTGAAVAWLTERKVLRLPAAVAQFLTLVGLGGVAAALLPLFPELTVAEVIVAALALAAGFVASAAPEWHGSARGHGIPTTAFAQLLSAALIAHVLTDGPTAAGWAVLGFAGLLLTTHAGRLGAKLDGWNFAAALTLVLGTLRGLRISTLYWILPGSLAPLSLYVGTLITALLIGASVNATRSGTAPDGKPNGSVPGTWQPMLFAGLAVALTTSLITQECSAGWLSFGWSVEGAVLLALGFGLRVPPLRYAGVGLLLVTAAKVLLSDVAHLPVPFRVLSFIGLGLILLAASWAYTRHSATANSTPAPTPTPEPEPEPKPE